MSRSDRAAEDSDGVGVSSARQAVRVLAVGKLETVTGLAAIKRGDGVVAQPAVGDLVYEGDQIETGADGLIVIAFSDGTTFQLYADACVVLDEFIYGAANTSNSALLRVLRGVFGFVSGKVTSSGRLRIDTPLGQLRSIAPTAGIGSLALGIFTVLLVRELKARSADVSFLDNGKIDYKDLKHGVFEIVTKGEHPQVIIVDDPSQTIVLRPRGSGVSVQSVANTPEQMAQYQRAYEVTYSTYSQGQQDPLIQKWQRADANPNSTGSAGSAGASQQASIATQQIPENAAPVTLSSTSTTTASTGTGTGAPSSKPGPTTVATWHAAASGEWSNPLNWSDAWAPYSWQNLVIDGNVTVTIDTTTGDSGPSATAVNDLTIGSLGSALTILAIVDGGSLVVGGTADIFGTIEVIDPGTATLTFNGPVKVETSGVIEAIGSNASIYFSATKAPDPGTYTVDNFGTILANESATVWFQQGAVINEATGHIEAENGSLMVFETGNAIVNLGLLEAITGSELDVKDSEITNSGTGALGILIDATSELLVDAASLKLDGTGQVALIGGTITGAAANAGNELENFDNTIVGTGTLSNIQLVNDAAGIINATGGALILNTGATINNAGLLEATLGGTLDVKDSEITNSGTGALGIVIDATSELLVDAASLKLDGTGRVSLIEGTVTGQAASAGNELENFDNTIVGTGAISNIDLDNDAAGIINATGGTLVLNTGATVDNAGLLEATVSGTLDVKDSEINNSGTGPLGIVIDATSELLVDVASLKLDGTGQVSLIGGTITGQAASAGNELNNFDNTIVGTGTISNIDLDNAAAGIIHVTGGTLILNTGTTVDNAGLLEATLAARSTSRTARSTIPAPARSASSSTPPLNCWSTPLRSRSTAAARCRSPPAPLPARRRAPATNWKTSTTPSSAPAPSPISTSSTTPPASSTSPAARWSSIPARRSTTPACSRLPRPASSTSRTARSTIPAAGTLGIVIDATSELLVDVASLALDGGGQVSLMGGIITGQAASSGNELNNLDNAIVGTGTISNIDLDNGGTIDATGGTLILTTGTTIDNSGLLEATSGGTLDVKDGEINNSGTGGRGIAVGAASKLLIDVASLKLDGGGQVSLTGGTITGQAAGSGNELDNVDNTIVGFGTISNIRPRQRRGGTIDATGARWSSIPAPRSTMPAYSRRRWVARSTSRTTRSTIPAPARAASLSAPPPSCWSTSLRSSSTAAARCRSAAAPSPVGADASNELENVNNTIVGFGTISNIDLDNDVAGTINATGGTLTLATGTVIDNAGLLEATSHGVLDVKDSEIPTPEPAPPAPESVIDGTSTLLVDVGLLKLDGGGTVTLEGTITGAAPNAGNELEDVDNPITATGPAATISNLHFVNDTTLLVTAAR